MEASTLQPPFTNPEKEFKTISFLAGESPQHRDREISSRPQSIWPRHRRRLRRGRGTVGAGACAPTWRSPRLRSCSPRRSARPASAQPAGHAQRKPASGCARTPPQRGAPPIRAEPEARFGSGYAPRFIPAPCPGVRCSVTPRRLRAVFAWCCVSWAAVRWVLERRPGGEWMARAHLPSTRAIRLSLPAVASARGTARGAQRLGPAWAC